MKYEKPEVIPLSSKSNIECGYCRNGSNPLSGCTMGVWYYGNRCGTGYGADQWGPCAGGSEGQNYCQVGNGADSNGSGGYACGSGSGADPSCSTGTAVGPYGRCSTGSVASRCLTGSSGG